jgi:integrase
MSEHLTRRQRRRSLTDRQVAALPKKRTRYPFADPEMRGHYVRVMPEGPNVFAAMARGPGGTQKWATLGRSDVLTIEQSRDKARSAIKRIKESLEPFEPPTAKPDSYEAVALKFLELHVAKEGLRSGGEVERLLRKFVLKHWGKRDFVGIKRRDINELLDSIAKESAWNADHVLAVIRKIANWYATRDDDYRSPFVVGMRRTKSDDRERDRILDDDELRKIWRAAEANGTFGALVRILLLTAQRRSCVVNMKSSDISADGVWEIPTSDREKGNAGALQLPAKAMAIINGLPRFRGNPYVFPATRGNGPLNGFNKRKAAFDKACGVTGWTLHDLRRTARSLMSRAGVSDEHAEHTLGHKLHGVKKVYNRYDYLREKSDALTRVAALIEHVVNPPEGNVTTIMRRKAKAGASA